jgi:uncharacterized protein (DUF2336 family)
MQVDPDHVRSHGSTAAIVLAVLIASTEGYPVVVSKAALARACGLHRGAVRRALVRLTSDGAIKVDRTRRLNRQVIHVLAATADRCRPNGVDRHPPTIGRSRVGARLDGLRALLDAVG